MSYCKVFDVCLLTIKYVSTVQYLSISFQYIHNLSLSHFSQLKVAVQLRCHVTALISVLSEYLVYSEYSR